MRLFVCGIVSLAIAVSAFSQIEKKRLPAPMPEEQKGEFTLSGRVVNQITGEGIKRSLVQLRLGGTRSVITDDSGAFRFDSLAAGFYSPFASKPSFQNGYSTGVQLTASKDDLEIRLAPLGNMSGKISDDAGEPLIGVAVKIVQSRVMNGKRESVKSREVPTDDRGIYRVWNLTPGNYYVMAAGRSGGTRLYLGDRAPSFDSHECFTPVYYGGSPNLKGAVPVIIKPGSSELIGMSLRMQKAYKIRGFIQNFTPYKRAQFELIKDEEDIAANRVSLNAATGKFEINDVTPGQYRLRVTQGEKPNATQGELMLTTQEADIDNVAITLLSAVPVRFHMPNQTAQEGQVRSTCSSPELMAQGQALFPGQHPFHITCFSIYPTSALVDGLDVLSTGILNVPAGAEHLDIEIVPGTEGGTLTLVSSQSDMAQAVVVPEGRPALSAIVRPIFPNAPTDIRNLAPGDYQVFLFSQEKASEVEYANPEAVKLWTGGTRIRISPNAREHLELKSLSQ